MKYILRVLFLIIIGLAIQPIHAEGPCPSGQIDIDQRCGGGYCQPVCAPIQNYNNNYAPPPPPVRWADRWGAIAIGWVSNDHNRGVFGKSSDAVSKANAETIAMNECKSQGGGDTCYIATTYSDSCIALAVGVGHGAGTSGGQNIEEAKQDAIRTCTKAGGKNCYALYSNCSMAVRVQ